jgi:catechol 2,3-dioxygenase-like lactoylglutathione lyase family enzyme
MPQQLRAVTLLIRDYDEAIAYFTGPLQFELVEDRPLSAGKRWVLVSPRGGAGSLLLLAEATTPDQRQQLGHQAGGRVAFFLETDDFPRDYDEMRSRGVSFEEEPRQEPYGMVAVFRDLYGNRWDLIQRGA